jgi:diguanylate cyclase (GGDEF)-like protein/PAS domain S-box-containing protein
MLSIQGIAGPADVPSVETDHPGRSEALLATGALQRAILNSVNFSSIVTDTRGLIQIFNVGAEQMLGYAASDVINRVTPADIADPQEVIGRAVALSVEFDIAVAPGFEALVFNASRGIEDTYELTYLRKDGTRLPAVVSVTALRDADNTLAGYLLLGTKNVAHTEVTERGKLERRVRDQQFYTRSLIESSIDALMTIDLRGTVTDVNKQTEALTACTRDELIGAPFKNHFTDAGRAAAGIERVLREGKVTNYELTARARDGRLTVVSYNATTFYERDRTLQGVFAAVRDMTELKRFEHTLERRNLELQDASRTTSELFATLFAEKERVQVTLDCIGDAVASSDIAGNITFLNLVAEQMLGWSREEALGHPVTEVFQILDANREAIHSPMEMAIRQDRTAHLPHNCTLIRRDGLETPIEDSVAPLHDRDGNATGAVIVFRDVSAVRAMTLEMTHLAQHDYLTGLPNRMLLNDRVSQSIGASRRHQKKVAVLFLDLDGFKHINDSLGHPVGDKLLQSIAGRLVGSVRSSDTVSRQGGDEFIVLLAEVEHAEDAAIVATKVLGVVAEPHSIDQHDLHVTTSVGISVYPDDGLDAETLVKNADTAMYQAKAKGRHNYRFFEPAMNIRAVERQTIEGSLRRALERREFSLHYQAKADLRSGKIAGAEALIRWTHPTRGPISPAQFIPVAEDSGLILPIGNWVLREACRQARVWAAAGLPAVTMAVNISAVEFRADNFLAGVIAVLDETGLDPTLLELELTESVLMKHATSTESILAALKTEGVRLAVDDFGTGYSSLSYLRKFPIDALKIDQSFVRQITTSPSETSIVTAVISMGRSLDLRVVAEGVETHEELAFLQAHHCDEAQGYYLSRPVVPEEFARLLETGIAGRLR